MALFNDNMECVRLDFGSGDNFVVMTFQDTVTKKITCFIYSKCCENIIYRDKLFMDSMKTIEQVNNNRKRVFEVIGKLIEMQDYYVEESMEIPRHIDEFFNFRVSEKTMYFFMKETRVMVTNEPINWILFKY